MQQVHDCFAFACTGRHKGWSVCYAGDVFHFIHVVPHAQHFASTTMQPEHLGVGQRRKSQHAATAKLFRSDLVGGTNCAMCSVCLAAETNTQSVAMLLRRRRYKPRASSRTALCRLWTSWG